MKKLLVILGFLACTQVIYAQQYYSSIGVAVNTGRFTFDYSDAYGESHYNHLDLPITGITYRGVYKLNNRVSIACNPFLGLYISFKTEGLSDGSFGLELPLLAQINFGDISKKNFYVGGGFTYSYIPTSFYPPASILGPQIELGGEFEALKSSVGFRAAYTLGVNAINISPFYTVIKESRSVIQLGVYYAIQ